MAVRLGNFVAGDAVAEVNFHGKASIAKQLERTVYGGLADAGIALDHVLIKFFKRVVPGQFKKSLGYDRRWDVVFRPLRFMKSRNSERPALFCCVVIYMPTPE